NLKIEVFNLSRVILYLAMSLDGYIADKNEGYSFLENYSDPEVYDFDRFMNQIGTIIMGRVSYQQMLENYETWPYKNYKTYVYTKQTDLVDPNVEFIQKDPKVLLDEIKQNETKDIWLFGGSQIIDLFIKENLVDAYWIYYVPEVLGKRSEEHTSELQS